MPVSGDPPYSPALVYEEYVVRTATPVSCPSPTESDWTVVPLFEGDDDDDDDELGRHCLYENATGSSPTPFVGLAPSAGESQDLGAIGLPGARGLDGPLLPAAWEAIPAVGPCPGGAAMPEPALPLLHAVGAVDAGGRELSTARPDSRPKLVAYGAHLVAHPASPWSDGSAPISGSSVATAVVSASAAMVAARLPNPTAGGILRHMLTGSPPTGPVAPWAEAVTGALVPGLVSGPAAGARQVRVCELLAGQGYVCPGPAPALTGFGEGTDPATQELQWATPEALAMCEGWTVHRDPVTGAPPAFNPCPQRTRWSVDLAPWVLPQPPTDGCSSCFLDLGARRLGLQPSRFAGWTDLTLLIHTPGGGLAYSLPQPAGGGPVVWSWRAGAVPPGATSADIVGVVNERTLVVPLTWVGP